MAGSLFRYAIAIALLTAWSLPVARLAESPRQRADALAVDAICWGPVVASPAGVLPVATTTRSWSNARQIAEVAALFEDTAKKQWAGELAQVLVAVSAAVALLLRWRYAPALGIAAAILYLWSQRPDWDAYRLLLVTESPRLWWAAIQRWSLSLWSHRLAAPPMIWFALLGACCLLLQAAAAWRWRPGFRTHRGIEVPTVGHIKQGES